MNLRQLEALYEVMLAGSVSEAARNMGRTQPAVSALIAVPVRGGRRHPGRSRSAAPNHAGGARSGPRGVADLEHGAAGLFLLPKLVSRFAKDRPSVRVTVMTRTSPQVLRNIASQQYDIGLADVGVNDADEDTPLVNRERIRMDCVCALAADDPLAGKRAITPADLDAKPIAALFPEHAIRRAARAAFEDQGATFDVRFETQINMPHFAQVEDGAANAITDPVSAVGYRHYRGCDARIAFRAFRPIVPFEVAILTPADGGFPRDGPRGSHAVRSDVAGKRAAVEHAGLNTACQVSTGHGMVGATKSRSGALCIHRTSRPWRPLPR